MRSLDKNPLYQGLVLSLPFREGTGTVLTHDVAKPRHPCSMGATPAWTQLASGIWVLNFVRADGDYISVPNASAADLNFVTATPFSGAVWVNQTHVANNRYFLGKHHPGLDGWCTYIGDTNPARYAVSTQNNGTPALTYVNSAITAGIWYLLGFSRSGASVRLYINGVDATGNAENHTTITSANGHNFYVGSSDAGANGYNGYLGWPRIWSRALAPAEHRQIWDAERHLFGV